MAASWQERVEIMQGDITGLVDDAIVNAANSSLLGGGGVDGAIHRTAGPGLLAECRTLGGCAAGEAKLTRGYHLPATYVIHTVGPVWRGGNQDEDALLAACYRNSLALASDASIASIAFPAISTGVFGFPKERAAGIALYEIKHFLESDKSIASVFVVCFSRQDYQIYQQLYLEILD